jgi:hypothetical protein
VLAQLSDLLHTGRNGGTWDGNGIISGLAAADALRITGLAALLNDNGSSAPRMASFGGWPVSTDDVLVRYGYYGDVDFNQRVNIDDYFQADLGRADGRAGFAHGDVDHSGAVDGDDFFLIDRSFLMQSGPLAAGPVFAMPASAPEWPAASDETSEGAEDPLW